VGARVKIPFFDLGTAVREHRDALHGALDEVIDSGYFVGGAMVERFESEFAAFVGVTHALGTANGLDSIRLILEGMGVGPGDEVIVPAFTYYATWLGVTQVGATPVPVDSRAHSANLDPELVAAAITPRTKVVLPVHLYGYPAELAAICSVADEHGLLVVEDAAQSHGAVSDAGMTGSVGHAAAFSFYPTKNLGALGDAGGVTTSDDELARRIRSRRSYGQGKSKYDHVDTGWNSRLDPLQAAFLLIHLTRLAEWTTRRRSIASRYLAGLGEARSSVIGPFADVERSVWHHFVLRAAERPALQKWLAAEGVSSDAHYPYAVHQLAPMVPLLSDASRGAHFPIAEALARQVTSLPMGPWMTDEQVEYVADVLSRVPVNLLAL